MTFLENKIITLVHVMLSIYMQTLLKAQLNLLFNCKSVYTFYDYIIHDISQ